MLAFLVKADFARHFALRRAFVICARPDEPFVAVLTCTACGETSVVTSEEIRAAMARFASSTGFAPHGRAIEGRCATCNGAATDHVS